jgi:hypothetical protein
MITNIVCIVRVKYFGKNQEKTANTFKNIDIHITYKTIECSFCSFIGRPEHLIDRHCGISRATEGHSFGDHLISVSSQCHIGASIVLCSVSLELVRNRAQSGCALNTR